MMQLRIHSLTSAVVALLKFGNAEVISSNYLSMLGVKLIHVTKLGVRVMNAGKL